MRWIALFVFLGGCARTVPLYSGITEAQVRWQSAYNACHGQATPECEAVRRQYAAEDLYERQERTAAMQREENADARSRRRGVAAGMASAYNPNVYQPQPVFTPSVKCTSTTYGNQTQTRCH